MNKLKISVLILLIAAVMIIAPVSAGDNQTVTGDAVQSNDYYFDVSLEKDGNGTPESPYNKLNSSRITENSVIHLSSGEYELDSVIGADNITIMGQGSQNTVVSFYSVGIDNVGLKISDLTLKSLGISSGSYVTAKNVVFRDFTSYSKSTINLYSGDYTFTNCSFYNNNAKHGAVFNLNSANITLNSCEFSDNHADLYGGTIYAKSSRLQISDSKFISNSADDDAGGALYLLKSDLVARNVEIANCSATFGGAIASLSGDLNLTNFTARNNRAKYNGGAIYKIYRMSNITSSVFEKNTAQNGGAVFAYNIEDFRISSNRFTKNTAALTGGAVYSLLSETYFDITDKNLNNTFSGNSAQNQKDAFQTDSIPLEIGNGNYSLFTYNPSFNGTLPSKYDLRDLNQVTPVKNQDSGGNCWSFAAIAALESSILKATGVSYDLSEENMKNLMTLYSEYGWTMNTNEGGYDKMALGYLTSWLGPVNESEDSYDPTSALSPILAGNIHVQNIAVLSRSNYTENDEIKRAIMDYGAVSTSIFWDGSNLKNSKNYYYTGSNGANHAVAIVGWDDDYSADNFNKKPAGNGAWIVKNSWGTRSGDKGFYYVSYYDVKCAPIGKDSSFAFVLNDTLRYDKNYQYDIAGKTDYFINYTNTVWYKNRFTATASEYLAAVSTYFEKTSEWDLSVYVNGKVKNTQSGTSRSGYFTIDLSNMIFLKKGDVFDIVFKIKTDANASVPISEAISLNSELYHENISFISYNGKTWTDLYDLDWTFPGHSYLSQVACIKAFTVFDKVKTQLSLAVSDAFNPAEITAYVTNQYGKNVSAGKVKFVMDGKVFYSDVKNGAASIQYGFSELKDNSVEASFSAEGYVASSSKTTANVVQVKLSAYDLTSFCGDVTYRVTLTDLYNSPVSGKEIRAVVGSKTYYATTDKNGIAAFTFRLAVGTFDVGIGFANSEIILTKKIATKSTVILPADTKYTFNSTYSAKLIDSAGNMLKNVSVKVTIADSSFSTVTDVRGYVFLDIALKQGSYKVTVTNPVTGEKKTQTVNVVARLSANDVSMYYKAGKSYTVKVYGDNGNLARNVEVEIVYNGNHYSRFTDSKGKVYLKITSKPGTYKITASYKGFKISNKITVKKTLITQNMAVKKSKTFKFKAKLLNTKGKVLKYKVIKVKFKGKTYKVKTNKYGIATFKIKAGSKTGKFTITTVYGSIKMSNKITVKS